ncbi:MAG TPA: hypothetical protein VN577_09090 [Terriglobales bacterium]|nr:hypothetical protein [Terriglobales bacterium]
MRKSIIVLLVVLCALSVMAGDKDNLTSYLLVQKVTVNNMKAETYPALIREFKSIATSVNSEDYWLAGTGITGNSYDVFFVSNFANFADLDKTMQGMEKIYQVIQTKNPALVTKFGESEQMAQSTMWHLSPALSYLPEKVDTAHATYWMVYTFHIKPGTMSAFSELVRERIDIVKKANLNDHWIAYNSIAGTDTAMMFVMPIASLSDLDRDDSEAMKTAFTPLVREHLEAAVQKTVAKIETQLIRVKPEFSRPGPNLVAANPDFWTVKEPVVTADKKVKKTKKAEMEVGK